MNEPKPSTRFRFALLGTLVAAGWVLYDLSFFGTNGRPQSALELLPGSCLAILTGFFLGGLAGSVRGTLLLTIVFLVAGLLPRFVELPLARMHVWLLRYVCLWGGAVLLAHGGERFLRGGLVRWGLCFGVLVCAVKMSIAQGFHTRFLPMPLGALAVLALTVLPRGGKRALGTVLAMAVVLFVLTNRALPQLALERPDLPQPSIDAPADATNLVLIVLDTVRADRFHCYGHERETTPNLDAFAERHAQRFTQARSSSPWTLPSHASLFTGLPPSAHGSTRPGTFAVPMSPDVQTLAERLRNMGYQTAAIVSNQAYLTPLFGISRGFEHFDNRNGGWVEDYIALAQVTGNRMRTGHLIYRDAQLISDLALDWIDETRRGEPFFLMLNYMDAHHPTMPPAPHDSAFETAKPADPLIVPPELIPLQYDRALHYLDTQVARVLDRLEALDLFENTTIVLTSDHGEGFGEHGVWRHGEALYEELVHVPLFLKPAGGRQAAIDDNPITGYEVHDRMLLELGLDPGPRTPSPVQFEWYGRRGTEVTDAVGWLEGTRKLIASRKGIEAYDWKEDPLELVPLDLSEEEIAQARQRALDWWDAHAAEDPGREETTEERLRILRALGYTGD